MCFLFHVDSPVSRHALVVTFEWGPTCDQERCATLRTDNASLLQKSVLVSGPRTFLRRTHAKRILCLVEAGSIELVFGASSNVLNLLACTNLELLYFFIQSVSFCFVRSSVRFKLLTNSLSLQHLWLDRLFQNCR